MLSDRTSWRRPVSHNLRRVSLNRLHAPKALARTEAVHLLCHCHLSFINRTTPLLVYDINDTKSHTNHTSYMQYGLKKQLDYISAFVSYSVVR